MTEAANSLYPEDWKNAAKKDWQRITVMLEEGDAEGAGFFLQQSLEKYLKAYLLKKWSKLKKIHNLHTLLDYALEFAPELEEFKNLCKRVTGYYFTERYPMLVPSELTIEDVIVDKADAMKMVKALFPEEQLT